MRLTCWELAKVWVSNRAGHYCLGLGYPMVLTMAPEGEEDDYHIMGSTETPDGLDMHKEHSFWVSISRFPGGWVSGNGMLSIDSV